MIAFESLFDDSLFGGQVIHRLLTITEWKYFGVALRENLRYKNVLP